MRLTIAAHWMTGQRFAWSVLHCVMVLNFRPFFWVTKVTNTLSAELRADADEWGISLSFKLKAMFSSMSIFVFLSCGFGTFRYSHDLHEKKRAGMISCEVAFWVSVVVSFAISETTLRGIAFCWIFLGSEFL